MADGVIPGSFIDGVYNYCDRWCERCVLQRHCRVYRDEQLIRQAAAENLSEEETRRRLDLEHEREEAARRPLTASEQLDLERFLEEANRPPTAEELAQIESDDRHADAQIAADPLTRLAKEYDDLTFDLMQSLRPKLQEAGDPVLLAAIETLEHFMHFISAKVHRALDGRARGDADDEVEDAMRSDSNCTAKLLRSIVPQCREAWQVLAHAGLGDGVPDRMIRRLERIDDELAERFPRALSAIRPGFDE